MHLTLLTDGIYPHQVGGMQKHSYHLAEFLARQGATVQLYHFGGGEASPFSEAARTNITEHVVPFPAAGRLPGHYVRNSFRHAQALAQAVKLAPATDFIYAQGYTAWDILARKAKGENWPPVCVNFHGMEALQPPASRRNQLEQWLLAPPMRRQLLQADFVQSLGGKLTEILTNLGIDRSRIWEIPIGLDPQWLVAAPSPAQSPRTFVFLGRYERRKGIEELNRVLLRLVDRLPFRFEFIGPIPTDKQVQGDRFIYHGLLRDQTKIQAILQRADVLVSPSHAEGMPTVILEAMASGCAIIATDVGAVCEEVNESVGWLIPAKEEAALMEALQAAIQLPANALLQLQKAAIKRVRNRFLWEAVAEDTLRCMRAVMAMG